MSLPPRGRGSGAGASVCLGGGSLEPFLGSGAGDDAVAGAEAEGGARLPMLGPQRLEPFVQLGELAREVGVVALREQVPELGAALCVAVDLGVDVLERSPALSND